MARAAIFLDNLLDNNFLSVSGEHPSGDLPRANLLTPLPG